MPTSRICTGHVVHVLDDDVADLLGRLHLRGDQAQKQLVIAAEQAGRIDQVGVIHRVQNVLQASPARAAFAPDRA